jgi:membrane associated rhomboid family serine protease
MQGYNQISPVPPLTRTTKAIIITCVAVYFVDFLLNAFQIRFGEYQLTELLGLVPGYIIQKGWVWQFGTYIFMHGNHLHLLLNMLILWYFGAEIEMRIGTKQFITYFFLCGIGAGLFNFGVSYLMNDTSRLLSPIIGASGAIYGILAAYGLFFGERYFLVFFLFPMKAKYFVLLIAAIELITGAKPTAADNVAHFAHLGGMIVGSLYIYLKFIRAGRGGGGKSQRDIERERLKKQFTLIVNDSSTQQEDDDKGPYWN